MSNFGGWGWLSCPRGCPEPLGAAMHAIMQRPSEPPIVLPAAHTLSTSCTFALNLAPLTVLHASLHVAEAILCPACEQFQEIASDLSSAVTC